MVVTEPVEEVRAAVVLPAAVRFSCIVLGPLNWAGLTRPVSCEKRNVYIGPAWITGQLPPTTCIPVLGSLLLPVMWMTYFFSITLLWK